MTTIHLPDVTYHRVMQKIDSETPGLSDDKLMQKTREKITSIVEEWLK